MKLLFGRAQLPFTENAQRCMDLCSDIARTQKFHIDSFILSCALSADPAGIAFMGKVKTNKTQVLTISSIQPSSLSYLRFMKKSKIYYWQRGKRQADFNCVISLAHTLARHRKLENTGVNELVEALFCAPCDFAIMARKALPDIPAGAFGWVQHAVSPESDTAVNVSELSPDNGQEVDKEDKGATCPTQPCLQAPLQVLTAMQGAQGKGDSSLRERLSPYNALLKPLPWRGTPDPDAAWSELDRGWPWMEELNLHAARALAALRWGDACIDPVLVVGPPGCGKSAWMRRFGELSGMAVQAMTVASSATNVYISGFERTYSSSTASLPARAFLALKVCNPLMLLDEIDKCSDTNRGSVDQALLPLLDRGQSHAYHDIFLQSDLECSRMSWMFSANSLAAMSQPFLDRVHVFNVVKPGLHQVEGVVRRMMLDCGLEQDLEHGRRDTLDGLLAAYSASGSLRGVERAISAMDLGALWSPPARDAHLSLVSTQPVEQAGIEQQV